MNIAVNTLTISQESLINQIESANEIGGRYRNLKCINATSNVRRGVLSLVFKGIDTADNSAVALKFMDPEWLGNAYRLQAFEREPTILSKLRFKRRCLQLTSGIEIFDWNIAVGGVSTVVKLSYFATEWLDKDIDEYFNNQHAIDAIFKLEIFRNVVLAIDALHSLDVYHRDLKPDNVRANIYDRETITAAIDFGTAAHSESESLKHPYADPVGAKAYAAPENYIGFSGDRSIGKLTDVYALGTMLYQLFNREYFIEAVLRNQDFERILIMLQASVSVARTQQEKLDIWKTQLAPLQHAIKSPTICHNGHSVPPSIKGLLEQLHSSMTAFDFNNRTSDLAFVIKKVDSALTNLRNHKLDKRTLERKRKLRAEKRTKILENEAKLQNYLRSLNNPSC